MSANLATPFFAVFYALFKAVVGLATTVAAVLGGWLAGSTWLETMGSGTGLAVGLKAVFLLSFAGRVASLWLLAGVTEEGATPVRLVAQALRPSWVRRREAKSWAASAMVTDPPHPHFSSVGSSVGEGARLRAIDESSAVL